MVQSLLVNFNPEFVNRVKEDAGPHALVTSSYVQGLRWMSDPSIPISGIYLNPNDSSYSALRFLTLVLLHRPATPVFLLDEENEFSQQHINFLKENFKIQGMFKGVKSFFELSQPLKVKVPTPFLGIEKRETIQSKHPGYIAVPIIDFLYSKHYTFNLFVEDETGKLRFFAMEGSEVDLEYLTFLYKKNPWIYLEEESLLNRKAIFQDVQNSHLETVVLPAGWRSAELLYRSKVLLEELARGGVVNQVVTKTSALVSDLQLLVSGLKPDKELQKFIDQASRCDRTVLSATYSFLLCSQLKLKSASIVESLGVASFFQDVSLYHTPFGNLSSVHPSKLNAEENAYYLTHPQLSSEMIAKTNAISELAVQIIRQHHERSDRTGFPNQVGGAQLQPLAEILSFINAQIDLKVDETHRNEVESHYSESLVKAWKVINQAMTSQKLKTN